MSLVTPSNNQVWMVASPTLTSTSQPVKKGTNSSSNNSGLGSDVITIDKSDVAKIVGTILIADLAVIGGIFAYQAHGKRKNKTISKKI